MSTTLRIIIPTAVALGSLVFQTRAQCGNGSPPSPSMPGFGPTSPAPGTPGPTTPGGAHGPGIFTSVSDYDSWRYWWEFNKERFLAIRELLTSVVTPETRESDSLLLESKPDSTYRRPSRLQITQHALPALRRVYEDSKLSPASNTVITNACIAGLAEAGGGDDKIAETLLRELKNTNRSISNQALLGLGILECTGGTEALISIFENQQKGRELLQEVTKVACDVRANAAISLGLLAGGTRNPHFREQIRKSLANTLLTDGALCKFHHELPVATILALTLIPDGEGASAAALEKYYQNRRETDANIAAQVPVAVARILQNASANERARYAKEILADLAQPKRKGDDTIRPSLAYALGLLTKIDDAHAAAAIPALAKIVQSDEPKTAHFAMIALGEIAGSANANNTNADAISANLLQIATRNTGRTIDRAWAALALGIAGFNQLERSSSNRSANFSETSRALRDQMITIKDPEVSSAFAISLGLRRDAASAKPILQFVDRVKSDTHRGYYAIALGLARAKNAAAPLHEVLEKSHSHPLVFRDTAVSLALLGDQTVFDKLMSIANSGGGASTTLLAAAADALGRIGEASAIEPLVRLLLNENAKSAARSMAASAIGRICNQNQLPWYARLTEHFNYLAAPEIAGSRLASN
ncbi:MAG: hypothetical protein ACKVS6_11605 [Planctomycetota bacterium]